MNRPAIVVQIAPGYSPTNPPGGGDWVDVSDRLVSFTTTRGRQSETDEFEPGSATIVFDSNDAMMTFWGGGTYATDCFDTAWCPVRILAVSSTVAPYFFNVFTGYMVDSFAPVDNGQSRDRQASITCTDWLGWAAQHPMPGSLWESQIASTSPDIWIKGDGEVGRLTSGDAVFDEVADDAVVSGPGTLLLRDSIVTDVEGRSLRIPSSSATGAVCDTVAEGTVWTMAFWFAQDPTGVNHDLFDLYLGTGTGGFKRSRMIVTSGGDVVAQIVKTDNSAFVNATAAGVHDDGEPHLAFARFAPGGGSPQVKVWTDLASGTATATSYGSTGQDHTPFVGAPSSAADASYLQELVVWESDLLGSGGNPGCADWVSGDVVIGNTQTVAQRLAFIEDIAGFTLPVDLRCETDYLLTPFEPSETLAEAIQSLAAGLPGGTCYCNAAGDVVVRDFAALSDATYDDEIGAGSNIGTISDDPDTGVQVETRGATAPRVDRVVNDAIVTLGNLLGAGSVIGARARSKPLIDSYGLHRVEVAGGAYNDGTTVQGLYKDWADDQLARFGHPVVELADLTVRPTNDDAVALVLKADLEKWVNYEENVYPNVIGGTTTVDLDYRVQRVAWSWSDGVNDFTVTLKIGDIVTP